MNEKNIFHFAENPEHEALGVRQAEQLELTQPSLLV
jgi:hypothetical protein